MNLLIVIAAAFFAALTGLAHSILGERRLIGPLLNSGAECPAVLKNALARQILRFAWHITTVSWFALAAILVIVVTRPAAAQAKSIVLVFGLAFLVMALGSVWMSRGRHVGWPLLATTAVTALVALVW